ncbi:MAG TPA: hypothetical protein VFF50_07965, partial [Candidatus Deferrimicrobiaceae bacterium]|nr:hypothetical protein [Candidatus Deferrimicrobiaceae bacterium]
DTMKFRILFSFLLTALFVLASSCGTTPNCPVCGTTVNGAYAVINVIPVPEHNNSGEPGGPFNSFDISTIAPNPAVAGHYLDYVSDRIGIAMQVIDTSQDVAVFSIQGSNAVSGAGNGASPCPTILQPGYTGAPPTPSVEVIPPIIDVFGNFTRYGCRTDLSWEGGPTFHLITGFGANGNFGGFPGAQCCASRGNGVNPMSGPDGNTATPDGKILFVGNGSSNVVVFDMTTMNLGTNPPTPPTILATIPTGVSADYDGPQGISGCIASWNGEAGSATDCGDDRADEMAYDPTHQVLSVINGDPGLPFVTFIDMSHIVSKTGTLAQQHCLPIDSTLAYGPYPPGYAAGAYLGAPYPLQGSGTGVPPSLQLDPGVGGSFNPPSCIIGQIYYDGAGSGPTPTSPAVPLTATVPVDTVGGAFPCPDPSNPHVFSGVSGSAADVAAGLTGIGTTPSGTAYTIPCHHAPILNYSSSTLPLGAFCSQTSPQTGCAGAIAPAGLGGMTYNPNSGLWLLANENSVATTNIGSVDVIDLQLGTGNGPVVVNSFPLLNCMPTGVTQGPGNNFLVGCADHDGESFPANEYIIDGTSGAILATINQVGGVDETWYNPGDNKYYLAARDMLPSAVMGVIDAKTNLWLANMPTGSNAHSISVDPSNNHVFLPFQAGTICTTLTSEGCIGVVTEQ